MMFIDMTRGLALECGLAIRGEPLGFGGQQNQAGQVVVSQWKDLLGRE